MVRFTVVLVAIGLLPTADADVAGELAHMLARYPEADADRDGILTEAEAGEYILRKFQRKRPNRGPGIGDRSLIKDMTWELPRAGILGVIGENGTGKTTLMRMIMGEEKPDAGDIVVGQTVELCYLDQSRLVLDNDKTVFEEVTDKGA